MSDDKKLESRSIGKLYAGEKACISLTSWRARINTVSKTLYSLVSMCPGFHIVLVLSEEEFPLMEKELPENLMLFVENELIEILWIYPNWKSFKKVLPTMDKYRDVPVISADDDCIYTCNYAQELYDKWVKHKNFCITFHKEMIYGYPFTGGYGTLHPPYCYKNCLSRIKFNKIDCLEDDMLYTVLRKLNNLQKCISLNKPSRLILLFHDEVKPLHDLRKNTSANARFSKIEGAVK